MQFRFIDSVFPPGETIIAGTERELTVAQATLYAGKAVNHLEPLDADAKALLDALRSGKPYEQPKEEPAGDKVNEPPKEPTRVELIEEAKALGIKGADAMKKDDLSAAIAAAKA